MLDRHPLVMFEIPEDGGATATATPEAEAGAVDAEATPGAVTEPEAEATPTPAPEVDWDNIDNLRTAAERLQALGYTIAPAAAPEPAAEVPAPDPFADDYQEQLERWYQAKRDADLGPVERFVQAQRDAEVDGQINGLLHSVAQDAKLGDLDDTGRTAFRGIADSFATDAAARHGTTPQAAKYAAEQAAQWLAARDKTAGEKAVRAYKVSIGEIADTPAEPSASGGGVRIEPKPRTYDEIIKAHAERHA